MGLRQIIQSVDSLTEALPATSLTHDGERKELLEKLEALKARVQTPVETTWELVQGNMKLAVMRIGIDLGVFDVLAERREADTQTIADIRGADPRLVFRVMRMLNSMGMIKEVGRQRWTSTSRTVSYADSEACSGGIVHFSNIAEVVAKLPSYFHQNDFQNPTDFFNGPWQYAYKQDRESLWQWLKINPDYQTAFHKWMSAQAKDRGQRWFQYYPVLERLVVEDCTAPLIVDVGGSKGHDLMKFRHHYPNVQGRLVLQDLPKVIEEAKALGNLDAIEAIQYDFFQPQPIKGAKAYYLHKVLHDWPDKQAKQILENQRAAMQPGSVLLIDEGCLPETNVSLWGSWFDLHMMATFTALERTKSQWIELFESVGLEVIRVWEPADVFPESDILFETRLKGSM